MGLLAQHQLFQYIDTHMAQYQEQIRALQTTLESLPEVDHRMLTELSPFPSGTDTHDNAIRIKQAAVLMILLSSVR